MEPVETGPGRKPLFLDKDSFPALRGQAHKHEDLPACAL